VNLVVNGLRVVYQDGGHDLLALDNVDLDLEPGTITALVGESGSGKTTLGKALMGLLPENARVQGDVRFDGKPLIGLAEADLNAMRWSLIAMVFQNGAASFNPVVRIRDQVAEPLIVHRGLSKDKARDVAGKALEGLGLEPELHRRFAHELSGGQVQKALIAMALILDPAFVILDEPTAALDPMTRGFVAGVIADLKARGKAVLLITHDLELAATLADTIAVLYLGRVMEVLPAADLFERPFHPYTLALGRAFPRLDATKDLGGIRGDAFYRITHAHATGAGHDHSHVVAPGAIHDDGHAPATGCLFFPRCTQAMADCAVVPILLELAGDHQLRCCRGGIVSLLELSGVQKHYGDIQALGPTDLRLDAGEVLCLVGETGSGKTTLAMIAAGVLAADQGRRSFEGRDMDKWIRRDYKTLARRIGVVYQNPAEAVSHRLTVAEIVAEPLAIQGLAEPALQRRVVAVLEAVRLPTVPEFMRRYPHELNLGAIQRVCLARALAVSPSLLVADEPTSALDPSVQAKVLKMMLDLQVENGLTMLFVTHDIGLARKIADRIAVMLSGILVEIGPAAKVLADPYHPYTRMLVNGAGQGRVNGGAAASGCVFAARCPEAMEICFCQAPAPLDSQAGRHVACCHSINPINPINPKNPTNSFRRKT